MRYLKDLLLTDTCLLKGHVSTRGQRLSTFLNTTPRRCIEMSEVTLIQHSRAETLQAMHMMVRVDEILLAHEMDVSGDEVMKLLAEQKRDEVLVNIHFGGAAPIQITGMISRRVIDRDATSDHDFLVILSPQIRGLEGKLAREYAVLEGLPYVIANRDRIAFMYQ